MVAWQSDYQDEYPESWNSGIYARRYESGTQIVDGDRIIGGVGDDLLVGWRGRSDLVGGAGDDAVDGGAGINTYEVSGTPDGFYAQVIIREVRSD